MSQDWRARVQEKIPALTNVLGWLEVDLDARLYFAKSLLLLCADRLFALEHDEQSQWRVREWPLTPDLQLSLKDYAGVGTLELHSLTHSMGTWRFTLGRNEYAQVFAEAFAARLNQQSPPELETSTQQQVDALLEDEQLPLQGNWGLLRLWRFAEPYKGQLCLGFVPTQSPSKERGAQQT